jgi:hypothetical protein
MMMEEGVDGSLEDQGKEQQTLSKKKRRSEKTSLHHRRLSHRRQIWTIFRWCGESVEESHHTTTHLELHGECRILDLRGRWNWYGWE